MRIFISIDGVLRNTIQKFDYHYKDAYLSSESLEDSNFEYSVTEPIYNDNLLNSYKFQSVEEFEYFLFIEYPIEIFGHAGLSYSNTFTELNKLIYENPEHEITLIGLNELGKAKPATLFFLSKNGFLGNHIRFIKTDDIWNAWNDCHLWITDNKMIVDKKIDKREVIKFNTPYNNFFTCEEEITKLSEIKRPWLKYSEKTTS